jgi:pimeloyl-ACP methyl ester carboxylesterase
MGTSAPTPRPFSIHVAEDVLDDLRARLRGVRWPDEIPNSGWLYGTNLAYMKALVTYWREVYDWRQHEALLNGFKHYMVPLGGVDLHFIHEPGHGPHPMPLLLSHGWPGSVLEFHKLIPLLTDPARFGGDPADAFTVIAPSLPGYGFSFRPDQPRFHVDAIADLFAQLMTDVLGYRRFGAQGGDWGASITSLLGLNYADRVAAIHLNLLMLRRDISAPAHPTDEERTYLEDLRQWLNEETGYQWIQGTRPQTLAYGLTDSPVGLAAWVIEKFRTWSDCGGDVERRFTKDELLTNVMIYWVTGAINASFWPYYARRREPWPIPEGVRVEVPTAYAAFPREIVRPPRPWAERVYNIQRWTPMPAGGHFAALEEPEALAADLRAFFRGLR